ncbi:hypothetical protein DY000_02021985 [Brassica cretica]|uniref:Uncharacterized protein n=1 Tax=Brassica cretica TaxID=69181 RepID=A0ABQ7E4E7_BRACR|nr:hypothetical protein DY000_02021985 [Brassica cretica]
MEGSPHRKFSFSRRKGVVPGTGPEVLPSGDPGRLLAGTRRPVSCLGTSLEYSCYPRFLSGRIHTLNQGEERFPCSRPGPGDIFLNR